MKILKTLVLALTITFFFSCESEQEIMESETEQSFNTSDNQNKAFAVIRRGRIQTFDNNNKSKVTVEVDNSSVQANTFGAILKGSRESLDVVLKPDVANNEEGLATYSCIISGDVQFKEGETVKTIVTPLNEDGVVIGDTEVIYITVEYSKNKVKS